MIASKGPARKREAVEQREAVGRHIAYPAGVDWITDEVAIGNCVEAHDVELLRRHGFGSVLSLDGTLSPPDARLLGVDQVRAFDLIDGAGNQPGALALAVEALEALLRSHPPVLVHCHAGRSRSVVVVAGFLARSLGIGPAAAIARVAEKRVVSITPQCEDLLYDYCPDSRRSGPSGTAGRP